MVFFRNAHISFNIIDTAFSEILVNIKSND